MESGGSQKLSDYLGFGWDFNIGVLCELVLFPGRCDCEDYSDQQVEVPVNELTVVVWLDGWDKKGQPG
jgi:hypothetical protein